LNPVSREEAAVLSNITRAVAPDTEHPPFGHASVTPFVFGMERFDHDPDPDETLMVSPLAALVMQLCTLDWSMLAVQVGLAPVHAASAGIGSSTRSNAVTRGMASRRPPRQVT
ncbi:MAG: hypothetical protein WBD46_03945, partial [Acidobacteriaceae bacterium]